jgi:branched-chain amino acid transport system ATP-binding protein
VIVGGRTSILGAAAGAIIISTAQNICSIWFPFPSLKSRLEQRAGTLSGGEKQMLALANALVLSPQVLLLDEPSLGLAPPLLSEALNRIQQISAASGVTVLIVEQKVREVLKIARRVYVLRNGQVSFTGPAEALKDDAKLREVYL